MQLTYLGHSCFLVETAGKRLVIDPFLTGNPSAACKADELKVDFILLSHGHDDHIGDAEGIAQRCGATIIAPFELAEYYGHKGLKTHGLNPGGGFDFPFGRVKLTIAHHSSSREEGGHSIYLGNPCGILLQSDHKTLYHAGDTALFLDMQLIGKAGLDVALIPIGDNYTMGPADALDALDFLKPKVAVPMHFNTWPPISQDGAKFATDAAARGHTVKVLQPGEKLTV